MSMSAPGSNTASPPSSNPNPESTSAAPDTDDRNILTVACQCGLVTFTLPSPPIALYHCHCRECRHQSASAFGTSAIFPASLVFPLSPTLKTQLRVYTRPGSRVPSGREMDCYFCQECGGRVLHRIRELDGTERATVSVKGGLIRGLSWEGGVHIFTEAAVVDVPNGVESYPGEPPAPDLGGKK